MVEPPRSDARARLAVAAIFFANGMTFGTWAAHIPLVEERLGIGHAALGAVLLALAFGALLAMPLGGAAISRLGSAAVTRLSTVVFLGSFPLALMAHGPLTLAAALLVFGAANGVMDVAMNAHGVAVEGRLGRPVMSFFHGMFSLGGLVGAGAAAALLPVMPPVFQALLMTLIAFGIAGAGLIGLLPSAVDRGAGGPAFALPNRATVGLGLLALLALFTEGAVLDWSALHLKTSLDLGAGFAAGGFAAFSACMAVSRFAGDRLRSFAGAVILVRFSAILAGIGLCVALLASWPALAIAGFAIAGLGLANLVPVFFGAAGRIPGQPSGSAIAAVATMGYAGFLAGPPLIGIVAQATTLAAALNMLVLACMLIGVAAAAVGPAERSAAGETS